MLEIVTKMYGAVDEVKGLFAVSRGTFGDSHNSVRHDGCVTSGFISFLKFPTTIDGYGIRFLACRGVGN